jgi:hypothetical protein
MWGGGDDGGRDGVAAHVVAEGEEEGADQGKAEEDAEDGGGAERDLAVAFGWLFEVGVAKVVDIEGAIQFLLLFRCFG